MTLLEMVEQGQVWQLVWMGVLFILMIIMISFIGKPGKTGAEKEIQSDTSANQKSGNSLAVTAAITAAVNEYRKTNN